MMEGMEEKLGAILSNPDMMRSIMSMAQSLGAPSQQEPPKEQAAGPDPAMLRQMMSIVQGSGIDASQQNLLRALDPYLSRERLNRLERAMRAARLANLAAGFLGGASHV